jgi:Leucine-rich repeat (LRR) protein
MTQPTEFDAVLGGDKVQPRSYDCVLGGRKAIARREEELWKLQAQRIFEIFSEAKSNETKKRALSVIYANLEAQGCDREFDVSRWYKSKDEDFHINYQEILEEFRWVRSLRLGYVQLRDISVLNCCPFPKLEKLEICQNYIEDISALGCCPLPELKKLDMSSNIIKDISCLESFSDLIELELDDNSIEDITPLNKLTKLEVLSVGDNYTTDISPLANLTNLKRLFLRKGIMGTAVSDITPLKHLTNLEYLDVQDCPLDKESIRVVKYLRQNGTIINALGTKKHQPDKIMKRTISSF